MVRLVMGVIPTTGGDLAMVRSVMGVIPTIGLRAVAIAISS